MKMNLLKDNHDMIVWFGKIVLAYENKEYTDGDLSRIVETTEHWLKTEAPEGVTDHQVTGFMFRFESIMVREKDPLNG